MYDYYYVVLCNIILCKTYHKQYSTFAIGVQNRALINLMNMMLADNTAPYIDIDDKPLDYYVEKLEDNVDLLIVAELAEKIMDEL